jgi:hypothetical protein
VSDPLHAGFFLALASDLLETALVAVFLLVAAAQAILRRMGDGDAKSRPRAPRRPRPAALPGHGGGDGELEGAGDWRALLEGRAGPAPASSPSAAGRPDRSASPDEQLPPTHLGLPELPAEEPERAASLVSLETDFESDRPTWQALGARELAHVPSEDAPAAGGSLAASLERHERHARGRRGGLRGARSRALRSADAWRDAVVAAEVLGPPASLRSPDRAPGAVLR